MNATSRRGFWSIGVSAMLLLSCTIAEGALGGPEIMMDEPLPSPSPSFQQVPAVAASQNGYLVVWNDSRNAYEDGNGSRYDLYGTRIDTNGNVLDPKGFLIHESAAPHYPAVSSDGTDFLVIWTSSDVFGARVKATGQVVGESGFRLCTNQSAKYNPAVSWSGTHYFAAWQDTRTNFNFHEIYGTRVSADGTILDPEGIAFHSATNGHAQAQPNVASDGAGAFVIWTEWDPFGSSPFTVYGSRIDTNGLLRDTNPILIMEGLQPSIAWNGGEYLVASARSGLGGGIRGTRVSSAGTVMDPGGFLVSTHGYGPEVVAVGTDYFAAWLQGRAFGSRVSQSGVVIQTNGLPISNLEASRLALAANGSTCLSVWEHPASQLDIYGRLIDPFVNVPSWGDFPISTEFNEESQPAVGYNGTNYLVVWSDNRTAGEVAGSCCTSGPNSVYGIRVNNHGEVIDPAATRLSLPNSIPATEPAVVSNGSDYLVVWRRELGGRSRGQRPVRFLELRYLAAVFWLIQIRL